MRTRIYLLFGILLIIGGLVQGAANAKKTSVTGLLFPSATPTFTFTPTATHTLTPTFTPTITLTPTKTLSPTIRPTSTPNLRMIRCAVVLSEFFALRDTVEPVLQSAFDTKKMKTTLDYKRSSEHIFAFTETYSTQYDPALIMCLQRTTALHTKDVELLKSAARIDFLTAGLLYESIQLEIEYFAKLTLERSKIFREVATDYKLLKLRYPAVDWPEIRP